ncbi:MAG: HAMP domain-containing protein [Alphaproteobacteria bacterium]|nr:HAMP domain-containing protein [Alphaproteobacteria bacterium]
MSLSRFFRSTGVRFTLLYVVLYLLSNAILLGALYLTETARLDEDLRVRVDSRVESLVSQYRLGGVTALVDDIAMRTRNQIKLRTFYRLTDARGRLVAGSLPPFPKEESWRTARVESGKEGREPATVLLRTVHLAGGEWLTVGMEPVQHEAIDRLFASAGIGVLLATLLLGVSIGALLSTGFLRRVDRMTSAVEDIMRGHMDRRVESRRSGDELDRLAASLNAMLDRIDFLMTEMREVTNSVAHDLRTPLSRLRRRLEEARQASLGNADADRALDLAAVECEGVLDTFNAILRIAQVEGTASAASFGVVDLSELVATFDDAYRPLAEEEGRPFDVTPGEKIAVRGDRELLTQLVSNLLDNALKHTPPATPLRLALERQAGAVRLVVEDRGPGIPEAARKKVFDRFFRLEASRTAPGNGLGLSLVAAIARLHGANVALEDAAPGLRAVLTFRK